MITSIASFYNRTVATQKNRIALQAVLVFLLPFERIPSLHISGVTLRLSQLVALALIFVTIGPVVDFYRSKQHLQKMLLPAFLFSYLLSALMASDLKRASMVFAFTVFVALTASAIAASFTAKQLPRIEKYLYIATTVVLFIGFYQYFGDVFGLNHTFTGLRDIYTKEVFGFPRIQSTALEPLYYGSFLLIPYLVLLAKRLVEPKQKAWLSLLFGAIVCQIVLTVSRGAIYSAIITFVFLTGMLLVKKKTTIKRVVLAALIVVAGAALALGLTWSASLLVNSKTDKFQAGHKTDKLIEQASNTQAQGDRVRNKEYAEQAFKGAPLLGIGPGNFSQYAIKRYPSYAEVAPVIVNNEVYELLAEAGIIGFLLFAAFAGWVYLRVTGRYLRDGYKNQSSAYWVPALLAYGVALAVQYQTFSTLYIMHVWVVIGLLMAFASAKRKISG